MVQKSRRMMYYFSMIWDEHQEWERQWWGDCTNTFAEEAKQITYAHRMGLVNETDGGHWPLYNLRGMSVLDIGGGPTSMLLKTHGRGQCVVADPCPYPQWVHARYLVAGIGYRQIAGEELLDPTASDNLVDHKKFDEAWIYNVLQHTDDPKLIIKNARALANRVRIFEWIDIPPHPGHPHELKERTLNEWLGGVGTVEDMRVRPENGCNAIAFYGVFTTKQ